MGIPCVQAMLLQAWGTPELAVPAHLVMSKGKFSAFVAAFSSGCVVLLPCHHTAALSSPEYCPLQEEF